MSKWKRISKRILALLLSVSSVLTVLPLPVSATEKIIEGGDSYHGYVELPGAAPESIYNSDLPIIQVGENIPSAYDSRDSGNVTSIKNQNPYGTCWSFSTMAALESSLLSQGIYEDVDLSEYHLVYYNFKGVEDPLGGLSNDSITYAYDMATALASGGNVTVAAHALANWVGAVEEDVVAYPTSSSSIEELPLTVESAYLNDIVHLQQAWQINKSDTAAIKQAIMDYGAVTGSFYYDVNYLNNGAYYTTEYTTSNHGVTIVGWDDNYSKSKFGTTPSADGAWLVKNSWGTWFGEGGYCWISYEDTSLQNTMCVLIGEKADNYDNNYQYDGTYMNALYSFYQATAGNVFRVQDGDYAESLDAVAFEIGSANVNYSIQIYTDLLDESNPTTGNARLTTPVTGTATFQGYYTIKLPESVLLEPNQSFSVVIDFDKGGEEFIVPVETSNTWNNIVYTSSAKANQSLLLFDGNRSWWDVGAANGTNLRIKAFTTNTTIAESTAVSGVSVTPENAVMYLDDTQQLTATVLPEAATNKAVTWTSSDSTVASVDANGLVTAKGIGEAVITCTTEDGGFTDTTQIYVLETPVNSVTLSPKGPAFYVGETKQLTATVYPENAANKAVTWSSSDSTVASVDANGLVTGHKAGSAVITVTTVDGSYTDSTKVNIMNIPVTSVTLTPESAELYVGETTQLTANVMPTDAADKSVTWSSSDSSVAMVDANGLVTAKKAGEATITCTTTDGSYTDTALITVRNKLVTDVSVTPENAEVIIGETVQLTATVVPVDATVKDVSWSSSDTSVADVDINGLVTTKKTGEVTITCTSVDGSLTDTATITVLPVSLVIASQKLLVGDEIQLLLDINGEPQDISVNSEYNWSVEPEGVVEISDDGMITGLGVGCATITCTHKEYTARTASVEVEIEIPFTDIKKNDWQYRYVVYAYRNNIMSGKGNSFGMNDELTREEFVTVLYNYTQKPTVEYVQQFDDVTEGMWYSAPITWAWQQGVSSGYANGMFGLTDNITREQLVQMLYSYAKKIGATDGEIQGDLSAFTDAEQVSPWAVNAMIWAVQNDMISGKPNEENGTISLDPLGIAYRGECATIMEGFIESTK